MRKHSVWCLTGVVGMLLLGACESARDSAVQSTASVSDAGAISGGHDADTGDAGRAAGGTSARAVGGEMAALGGGSSGAATAVSGSGAGPGASGAAAITGAAGVPAIAGASGAPASAGASGALANAAGSGGGGTAPSGADCDKDPLANLQPLGRGFFQEFRGLFGCTAPADLALYRQMLPEKIEMPADPQVCFYVVHFAISGVGPYNEAAILLPVEYAEQPGKYVLTMPLDNLAASSGGRAQGFPKYIAEEVSLSDDGHNNWTGAVRNAGQIDLQASYTGACRAGGEFPFPDFINLTPIPSSASQREAYLAPRAGSALLITSELLAEPQFYSLEGTVQMQIGDALPWNGLFDEAKAFPAQLVTFKGGIDLGSRPLD